MSHDTVAAPSASVDAIRADLRLVIDEVAAAVGAVDPRDVAAAVEVLAAAPRVFAFGQGRSGIALRAVAMRLMHLGLTVHVIGEATAPAIAEGDVLLVASGSGTTGSIVRAADTAADAGASVVAITAVSGSPVSTRAAATVIVPAASKTDLGSPASAQYAGSLFEQSLLLVGDAIFHTLWRRSGAAAEDLWVRHANVE